MRTNVIKRPLIYGLADEYTNGPEKFALEIKVFLRNCLEQKLETLILLYYSGLSQFSCINTNPSMNDWI